MSGQTLRLAARPRLSTEMLSKLPKLAWLTIVDCQDGSVHVRHGSAVEVGSRFAVEGVWNGGFAEAGFHRAEHFFGSGVRLDEEEVWLVPSRALVDRILYCQHGHEVVASNSLALLLAFTGARLDPQHDYRHESFAILEGLRQYDSHFVVKHPAIHEFVQAYHDPVVVSGAGLERRSSVLPRPIASFEEYVGLLSDALRRMEANATDASRRAPMTLFCTVSGGYDSAAVTMLARGLGLQACFTSRRSGASLARFRPASIDDGSPVARHMGLPVRYLIQPRNMSREEELYFLAPSTAEPELVFHSMARWIEEQCPAAVVFTGFHGDKVWDVDTKPPYLTDELKRGDTSGLNLSEIRLKAGFVNAAVPFLHARSIADLVAIARSPEMEPWRLHTGYDRPVPRRIIESAGVPRGAFARRKNAVVRTYSYPVSATLRREFFAHLKARHGLSSPAVYWAVIRRRIAIIAWVTRERLRLRLGGTARKARFRSVTGHVDLAYELHLWALETLAEELHGAFRADRDLSTAGPATARSPSRAGPDRT